MDWTAAIEKNREALKRILAMLIAMAEVGLGGQFSSGAGGQFTFFPQKGADVSRLALAEKSKLSPPRTLPRQLYRAILRLLRPAEAAARRLIIVAARGLVLPPPRPRQPAIPSKARRAATSPQNPAPRAQPLPLLDRLSPWNVRVRRSASGVPRISVPGYNEPFPIHAPSADDPIDATRLSQRFKALAAALDDLPGQARRFARWRARSMPPRSSPPPCGEGSGVGVLLRPRRLRHVSIAPARSRRVWPLRPGWPPGWRRKPTHEVHEVLDVVHGLAHWVLTSPDTS